MERISYTIPEACKVSGLSRSKIYELIGTKQLRRVKIGRSVFIRHVDLESLMAERLAA